MDDILHTLISLLESQEEIKITYREVQEDVSRMPSDNLSIGLS